MDALRDAIRSLRYLPVVFASSVIATTARIQRAALEWWRARTRDHRVEAATRT